MEKIKNLQRAKCVSVGTRGRPMIFFTNSNLKIELMKKCGQEKRNIHKKGLLYLHFTTPLLLFLSSSSADFSSSFSASSFPDMN